MNESVKDLDIMHAFDPGSLCNIDGPDLRYTQASQPCAGCHVRLRIIPHQTLTHAVEAPLAGLNWGLLGPQRLFRKLERTITCPPFKLG
eukprot:3528134-Amphidinium_carterae.2